MKQFSILTIALFILINTFSMAQTFNSESSIKEYWKSNGIDKIEGIYESTGSYIDREVPCTNEYGHTICYSTWRKYKAKYTLALVKLGGEYKLIYLSGDLKGREKIRGCKCDGIYYYPPPKNQWSIGEIKARLYKTATPDFYKCDWYFYDKSLTTDSYISFDKYNYFTLLLPGADLDKDVFLKLYPTVEDNIKENKHQKSSGTGFAISSNGIIVTNHHIIDGAKTIIVRGVNSEFNKIYKAKVLISDKNNDLAIVQIDDFNFTSLGTIPYTVKMSQANVGESIFVLGYPLRATMGDEIKLTNGIVSSKTGFQGDITSYQISAPIQPGNSGGPLFNNQGNLIGIINAKHIGAENVSYAVKSIYLSSLMEQLPSPPKFQTVNALTGKALAQQVEFAKKFVYIIETD